MHYIEEQKLGNDATEADARKMIGLLKTLGYDCQYGQGEDEIPDDVWQECLDQIAKNA